MKKKRIFLGLSILAATLVTTSCVNQAPAESTGSNQTSETTTSTPVVTTSQQDPETTQTQGNTKQSFSVVWKNDDGQVIKSETLEEGTQISAPANPIKTSTDEFNFSFDGWYSAQTGGEKVTNFGLVLGNVEYFARFTEAKNQYTYTFYAEDGTTEIKKETVDYGTEATLPTVQTKENTAEYTYEFDGWYSAVTGGDKITDYTVRENVSYPSSPASCPGTPGSPWARAAGRWRGSSPGRH